MVPALLLGFVDGAAPFFGVTNKTSRCGHARLRALFSFFGKDKKEMRWKEVHLSLLAQSMKGRRALFLASKGFGVVVTGLWVGL